jgi:adenylate cyclase
MALAKNKVAASGVALLLIIIYAITLNTQFLKAADYYVFDQQAKYLAPQLVSDSDIVVIMIDDYSLTKMRDVAGRWVWPRTVHAQLLEAIVNISPTAIVFDILFAEKDIYRPDADSYFNEVLNEIANSSKRATKVFFATLQQNVVEGGGQLLSEMPKQLALKKTPSADNNAKASFVLPWAIEPQFWQLGTINFSAEFDGIGRYYDVRRNIQGWQLNSLPTTVVSSFGLALPKRDKILLQWRGDTQQPFKTLSYADVYRAASANDLAFLKQFENKIILIGASASGLFDARATPINHSLPGVYMLATALDNFKNQRFLTPLTKALQISLTIVVILLIFAGFMLIKEYGKQVLFSALLLLFTSLLLLALSEFLLVQQQLLFIGVALSFMLLSFLSFSLFYGYLEYQQRQQALTMFARFLDPQVVYRLLKEDALSLDKLNKKQMVTILFSDIRGFTQLSEQNAAEDVVKLLNDYFNQQVAIIFKHHGTLDKFIGDCIMAFWGAPENNEDHAKDAIEAALAMEQQLLIFRKTLAVELQNFDVGIGIHSGESIVGMIGADLRVDYTVIGDAVNLASRIEGLTKNTSRILVSEQTKVLTEAFFDFDYQGEHLVKGRESLVKLYRPAYKK